MDDATIDPSTEQISPTSPGYRSPIPEFVDSSVPTGATTEQNKPEDASYLFNADAQAILEEAPTLDSGLSLLSQAYQSKKWGDQNEAVKIASDYAKELRYRFKDKESYKPEEIGKVSPFTLSEFDGETNVEKVSKWEKANNDFLSTTTDPDYVLIKDKLSKSITDTASNLRRTARSEARGTVSNAIQDTLFRALEGATSSPAKLVGLDSYVKGLKERTDPSYDDDLASDITQGLGILGGATVSAVGGPIGVNAYLSAQAGGRVKETTEESFAATGDINRATKAGAIEGASQIIQTVVAGKLFEGPAKAIISKVRGIPLEQVTQSTLSRIGGKALVEAGTNTIGGAISNEARGYGTDNPNIGIFDHADRSALVGALFGAGIGGIDVATNPTARVDPAVRNGGVIPPTESSVIGGVLDSETTAILQSGEDKTPPGSGFVTKDGNIYVDKGNGNTSRIKANTQEVSEPFDRTFFVDKGTAVKLAALRDAEQADGSLARIYTDGDKLLIKGAYVNEDLTLSKEPTGDRLVEVPIKEGAAPELHPVDVNRPKNINGNELEYRTHIGREISEVTPPVEVPSSGSKSIGAASIFDTLERSVSKRVRLSPVLGEKVREVFGDSELGLDRYFRLKDINLKNQAGESIGTQGVEGATNQFLSLPEDYANPQSVEVARQLIHSYNDAANEALKAGDTEGHERISGVIADIAAKASEIGTNAGQTGSAFRLWESINPETHIAAVRGELNNKALSEVASESGLDTSTLKTVSKDLENTKSQIKEIEDATVKKELAPSESEKTKLNTLKEKQTKLEDLSNKIETKKKEWQKKLSPEDETALTKLVKVLPNLKEGSTNYARVDKAIADLKLKALEQTGSKQKGSFIHSLWIANTLSNLATHFTNFYANLLQLGATPAAYAITGHLGEAAEFVKGLVNSIPESYTKAGIAFTTGETAAGLGGAKGESHFDLLNSKIPILNKMGYVLRALSASDQAFYVENKQGQARAYAYYAGKQKGLTPGTESFSNYMAEELHNGVSDMADSLKEANNQAEALKEAGVKLTPKQIKLSAWEIMEGKRSQDLQDESSRFALEQTFNGTPKGFLGAVYDGLNTFRNAPVDIAGITVRPVKYGLAFLRTTTNVANEYLNFTPVGAVRALSKTERVQGGTILNPKFRDKHPLQQAGEAGRAMIGALAFGTLYGIAHELKDQKDPYFSMWGPGPTDIGQKKQLIAEGWSPYTIKIGSKYIKYANTPLGLVLGGAGALLDMQRYNKKYARATLSESMSLASMGMMGSFTDNSFLKNVTTLIAAVKGGDTEGKDVSDVLADTLHGFVPGSGMLRFFANAIDDPIASKGDFWAKFISGIPVVERLGTKPALNAFGEPVGKTFEERTNILARVYSSRTNEPNWKWLAETGYRLPDPGGFETSISKSNPRLNAEREKNLGPEFIGIMSREERQELTKKSGPQIKAIVQRYRERYGTSAYQENVQKNMTKEISGAVSRVKRQMFLE